MTHPALQEGNVVVITGGALGIGRAAARYFARAGLRVCLADLPSDDLDAAASEVSALAGNTDDVVAIPTDVGNTASLEALRDQVHDRFRQIDVLMNNAAARTGGDVLSDMSDWHRAVDVNLWGVIHGVHTFLPDMLAQETHGCIINVGSKQGMTNPPGNPVYNLCKAAVISYTESLQHYLRNLEGANVTACLLVPGWTTTGNRQHQPGAWLPDQVVERMVEGLTKGDFYIVCPDNEVSEDMDRKRILWGAGDITENRPPLSRWHGGYDEAFAAWSPPDRN